MLLLTPCYRLYQWIARRLQAFLPWRVPELIEGTGSLSRLPALLKREGIQRLLIVTDQGIVKLGLVAPLIDTCREHGIGCFVFDETVPNPTIDNIESALMIYRNNECQGILAFGGGSPMDCAKGVGARVARPRKSIPQMKGLLRVRRRLPPLVAVPTTAGTGSEATLTAVVSNPATHEKYAINDHALIPAIAILDPMLTLNLPPHITATTGMDALTHAIEAFIGRSNTEETEKDAIEAVRIIMRDLTAVYHRGEDIQRRANLLKASFLAGRAFTRAYVGYVHAIAHTLGGFYSVPHGLANAIILPHVLDYYGKSAERRLALLARRAGVAHPNAPDAEAARTFIARIRAMNAEMSIPASVNAIRDEDISLMVKRALAEANPLYPVPRILGPKELTGLYHIIAGRHRA